MKPSIALYAMIVVAAVAIVVGVLRVGARQEQGRAAHASGRLAVTPPDHGADERGHWRRAIEPWTTNFGDPLAVLMRQLLVIVLVARWCGAAAQRLRQPRVVGEMAAGLLLGPSLLGLMFPALSRFVFPAASLPTLQVLSQIGVTVFMFGVGLHVDATHVRRRAHAAVAVSHVSILVPFCLGTALSLLLYRSYAPDGVPFRSFALFMGVGMSITAFPVLARIIEERRLTGTSMASMVLTCAAVDDVTAWTLLAFVVALVTSGGAWEGLVATAMATMIFLWLGIVLARPAVRHVLRTTCGARGDRHDAIAMALVLLLAAALCTQIIGIHALFGAFFLGAILPVDGALRDRLRDGVESLSAVIMLPVFFAFTGLRVNVGLLDDAASWAMCASIIGVATIGKLGGSMVAARVTGVGWRAAFAVGALMNTRGLMELVALNLGYELGLLSPQIFTMMVVMALATTMMAGPLLDLAGVPLRAGAGDEDVSPMGRFAAADLSLASGQGSSPRQ